MTYLALTGCFCVIAVYASTSSKALQSISQFVQCPYEESACRDDINCGDDAMSRRSGYFCDVWPFYSGGFAQCCNENEEYFTCTHSIYSPSTNAVFCDFWYMTQQSHANELQLCDCKVNNGQYCTSWICAVVEHYDFDNPNGTSTDLLQKVLLSNVEIFGVESCGYFTDHILTSTGHQIEQYCYKYDDFKSCFCVPSSQNDGYCKEWICHKYLNNAKNDLSLNDDYNSDINYWNISSNQSLGNLSHNISSSAIDMLKVYTPKMFNRFCLICYPKQLSTKVSEEEYSCTNHWSNKDRMDEYNEVDKSECSRWRGNLKTDNERFSVMECGVEAWNADASTFDFDADFGNLSDPQHELVDTYSFKWRCQESGMDYRQNDAFTNFYLSTILWSVLVGFVGLFLILCYMKSRRHFFVFRDGSFSFLDLLLPFMEDSCRF